MNMIGHASYYDIIASCHFDKSTDICACTYNIGLLNLRAI